MKCFFIIILTLLSSLVFSQTRATTEDGRTILLNNDSTWEVEKIILSCELLISTKTDSVTDESFTGTREGLVLSHNKTNRIISSMLKFNTTIVWSLNVVSADECIEENTAINIIFDDGSKFEMSANNNSNCDQEAVVFFGPVFGNKKELIALSTKLVQTIRVNTKKSFVQEDLTPEQAKSVRLSFQCLNKI